MFAWLRARRRRAILAEPFPADLELRLHHGEQVRLRDGAAGERG